MFRATTDGFNARQRHVHSMTWDGYNATQSLGPQHRGGATADDARPAKVARLSPPGYFQQYNFDDRGRVLDECSMHALNSTLVNCLDRPPNAMALYSGPSATRHARCSAPGPRTGSPAQPVRGRAHHAQQIHMAEQLAR